VNRCREFAEAGEKKLADQRKIIGILGIGNLLLGDEGFGVHVIRYLEKHWLFPEEVRLMDGGTAGIYMAPFLEDVDRLIVVDVVAGDGPPGAISLFSGEDLRGANVQLRMSPHQLGLLEVMEICRLRDQAPAEVQFIGVAPAQIETGIELSALLSDRVAEVAAMILNTLEEEGVHARNIPGAGIAATAC
jgi:hydrogenase maturation protease